MSVAKKKNNLKLKVAFETGRNHLAGWFIRRFTHACTTASTTKRPETEIDPCTRGPLSPPSVSLYLSLSDSPNPHRVLPSSKEARKLDNKFS